MNIETVNFVTVDHNGTKGSRPFRKNADNSWTFVKNLDETRKGNWSVEVANDLAEGLAQSGKFTVEVSGNDENGKRFRKSATVHGLAEVRNLEERRIVDDMNNDPAWRKARTSTKGRDAYLKTLSALVEGVATHTPEGEAKSADKVTEEGAKGVLDSKGAFAVPYAWNRVDVDLSETLRVSVLVKIEHNGKGDAMTHTLKRSLMTFDPSARRKGKGRTKATAATSASDI